VIKQTAPDEFVTLLQNALSDGSFVKLTLGKPAGVGTDLLNLFIRPVTLRSGPRLAFVWSYKTRDITKNHEAGESIGLLKILIGTEFLDAHLFTTTANVQLEMGNGAVRIRTTALERPPAEGGNDREKARAISPKAPWLRALGVTNDRGRPLAPMMDKFRQIERFAEILRHLLSEAPLATNRPLRAFDMGCGKGYLTFAACELLGDRARICGIEARSSLVDYCTKIAAEHGLSDRLAFRVGSIAKTDIGDADILVALHACDTATDDALAKGIDAGAALIVVAPCCQKEIRPQIVAPTVLAGALKHGIFEERQAEFVTDALRAQLLEWAGYRTRVMEFISSEHTAKNTMITAVKTRRAADPAVAEKIRAFAAFYGVRRQALAIHLKFDLG
jgi:SAM-dependent methyltransferase